MTVSHRIIPPCEVCPLLFLKLWLDLYPDLSLNICVCLCLCLGLCLHVYLHFHYPRQLDCIVNSWLWFGKGFLQGAHSFGAVCAELNKWLTLASIIHVHIPHSRPRTDPDHIKARRDRVVWAVDLRHDPEGFLAQLECRGKKMHASKQHLRNHREFQWHSPMDFQ